MDVYEEIDLLRAHIEELETRLSNYNIAFCEAAKQRDLLALDAAWGVTNAIAGIIAFLTVFLIASEWLGLEGWLLGLVAGVFGVGAQGWAYIHSDKGRFKDRDNMYRFPEWHYRAFNSGNQHE